MDIQEKINSTYPPTHTFDVETLKPTKSLADRVAILNKEFPGFFSGKNLLDLACNKGWFSMSSAGNFKKVVSSDIDSDSIEMFKAVNKFKNIEINLCSFRSFYYEEQFDRIFIGNAAHYFYQENKNHVWIKKLYALSSDLVLIEGPVDKACSDLDKFDEGFNSFDSEMKKLFTLKKRVPTILYTPDRYFSLWEKKKFEAPKTSLIHKKYKPNNNIVSIQIASLSPISNGGYNYSDEGWDELALSDSAIIREAPPLIQKKLFRKLCEHNIYLSSLGYIDTDFGLINFFKNNTLFDKCCVEPLCKRGKVEPIGTKVSMDTYLFDVPQNLRDMALDAVRSGNPEEAKRLFTQILGDVWFQS